MKFLKDKKKYVNKAKKLKNKVLTKVLKQREIDEFSNSHFSSRSAEKYRTLSLSIFLFSVVLVVFIFAYISFKNKIQEMDSRESLSPLKIVIPHPNEAASMDDYKTVSYKLKTGDSINRLLVNLGMSNQRATHILGSLRGVFNVKKLKVGQVVNIKYKSLIAENGRTLREKIVLEEIKIPVSTEEEVLIFRNEEGEYRAKKLTKALVKHFMKYKGEIDTSLYVDGVEIGVPANIMMELIRYYSFDVDFQRDIRKGDKFELLFESYYTEDGEKVRDGKILYTALELSKDNIKMYRHKMKSGYEIFFDENGKSVQKSLLRTPINGARISSGYGMRRHPILGYSKMHKGVDFAAPTGTPFFAAGNGTITKVKRGWNGGFGNYIRVRHNNSYSTEYAHISRFARGMRVGKRVRQGQVIAYVGNTGRSTGPHLHYGVLYKNKRIHPRRVRSVSSVKLKGKDLIEFKKVQKTIDNYRLNTPNQNRFF